MWHANLQECCSNQEYVKVISGNAMQSNYGFDGLINACWKYKMFQKEMKSIPLVDSLYQLFMRGMMLSSIMPSAEASWRTPCEP
nr:Aminoacrylate hydrolase [Ipomoea batatas]